MLHHKYYYKVGNTRRYVRGHVLVERQRMFIQAAELMRLAYILDQSNAIPATFIYKHYSVLRKRTCECSPAKRQIGRYRKWTKQLVLNDYTATCFYRQFIKFIYNSSKEAYLEGYLRYHHISSDSIRVIDMFHLSYSDLEGMYHRANAYLLGRGYDVRALRYHPPSVWSRLWNYLTFQKNVSRS